MSEPIRVAQVLAGAPVGGAENFYARLVGALGAYSELQQHAFTRANPAREATISAGGVGISRFRFGGRFNLIDRHRYNRALRTWNPDVVLTYMNRATEVTKPGPFKLVARLGHYYDLKYYRHCDHWIGIARGICDHMIQGGLPATQITHIPNFVDETPAAPLSRDTFDTPENTPLVFALGRLHTNKAFDILLQAMRQVPEAYLWLAGDGPEEAALKAQCDELGISERVRFLGWRKDVNALMRTADLFVCPSRHEGLGSIIPEAWFNGTPMVATNSQGPGELIENGVTGLVTPVDEVEPLADAINQLLQNPAQASALAKSGQQLYFDKYSREHICGAYIDLFKQLTTT